MCDIQWESSEGDRGKRWGREETEPGDVVAKANGVLACLLDAPLAMAKPPVRVEDIRRSMLCGKQGLVYATTREGATRRSSSP